MTSSTIQSTGFDGSYIGQIQGTATNLQLATRGNALSGNANAGGYIYNLAGTVQGDHCAGRLQDPQNGAAMAFEAAPAGRHPAACIYLLTRASSARNPVLAVRNQSRISAIFLKQ
jgi:hypothetical protein